MNAMVQVDDIALPASYGLVPSSMTEAMQLAEMMASSKLVPRDLQKSPADCLMVIQQAVRWQMDPFAVAQECSVIQGKLMHSGKLVAAVVNARGNLTQRLSFEYKGTGDDRTIIVSGQLRGELEPRVVEVTLRNAKTQNGMWTKQPDQQLMYHGARVWARRHTPELMLGIRSPEEFDEVKAAPRRPTAPAPNVMLPPPLPSHDAETGEIIEDEPASAVALSAPPSSAAPSSEVEGTPNLPGGAVDESEIVANFDAALAGAAEKGMTDLQAAWKNIPPSHHALLKGALDRRHKPRAREVDAARAAM